MAGGIHLFPSRTQQLSPHTSKVLGWKRPGRIESCRLKKEPYHEVWFLFFMYEAFYPDRPWPGTHEAHAREEQ